MGNDKIVLEIMAYNCSIEKIKELISDIETLNEKYDIHFELNTHEYGAAFIRGSC